tara:strand:+ start:482 stop:922 length:441 start_codon:yes stop_codon:yes gene_type:complete
MSKREENLIGNFITLYLDGGWEVSGIAQSVSDSKIVIEQNETKELFLIFREKVSCLKIGSKNSSEQSHVPRGPERSSDKEFLDFPMNKIAYDDTGMTIPQGLLNNPPNEEDDFSVTFGGGSDDFSDKGRFNGGIEFRIDDDSKKED